MTTFINFLLAYIILIPFIIINLFFSFGFFFQRKVAKIIHENVEREDHLKNTHENLFRNINILIWISVGIITIFLLENPISLGTLFVFLAFRSGATFSKRFILGNHDIKIMKKNYSDGKFNDIISTIIKISIIIELLFLLAWGAFYQSLNVYVKTFFEIQGSMFVLLIWLAGLIYGIVFSAIQSITSDNFLLKNQIGIALLLSGELVKNKIKDKKDSIKHFFKL
ncbi:MAG: conserved membrane protein of unknown function [Promethearchaeota archaeon]|nr:MAG: conserved membrane protein of unknown function [Candidatus Lokiarchaeota archaeon]